MRNNLYIITDFDYTLTSKDSNSSWSVLDSENIIKKEDLKKSQKYKDYYSKIEKEERIKLKEKHIKNWYISHLNIFINNKITEKQIKSLSMRKNCMKFRKGAKKFLKYTHKEKVPVIIISAGIGDVIKNFLKANKCLFDNVYIVSNIIKYKNGVINGFREKLIHSLNKNEIDIPVKIKEIIKDKSNVIMLGDNISDILKIPEHKRSINIVFSNKKEYQKYVDILYDENESLDKIIDIIKNID